MSRTELILIDIEKGLYSRYEGKKCVLKVRSLDHPLTPQEIETLRTRPNEIMPDDPDSAA